MATAMKTRPKQQAEEKPHPVFKARLGSLQMAIWGNEHVTEDGEVRIFHTINIERNFKNSDDEWQKTTQLRAGDLGDSIALQQQAQVFLTKVE